MAAASHRTVEPGVTTDVGSGVDLPAEAAFFATWKDTLPLALPPAKPFDAADALKRLGKIREHDYYNPDWRDANISPALSNEETEFWLAAVAKWCEGLTASAVTQHFKTNGMPTSGGMDAIKAVFAGQPRRVLPRDLAGILANAIGPVQFLDKLAAGEFRTTTTHYWARGQNELAIVRGAWETVRPYLTPAEVAEVRELLRPRLTPDAWPKKYDDPLALQYHVAALVGMHDELWQLVRGWDFGPHDPARYVVNHSSPLLLLLGLRDSALADLKARQLSLALTTPFELRAWLAHTGMVGLDYAAEQIVRHRYTNKSLLDEFARVKAPAVARHMLAVKVRGRNPAPARTWLDENVGSAVAGLLPLATGKDKLASAALDYLRDVTKRGYGWVVERELATADAQVVGKVRRAVLDKPERVVPHIEPKTEPEWLKKALAAAGRDKPGRSPAWLNPATLPPIVVEGRRLTDAHVVALIAELRSLPTGKADLFGPVAPLSEAVKRNADPASCDAFALALYERWVAEKTPTGDSWVLGAIGRLGGDAAVNALVSRLMRWPGGASSKRVKDGLAAVRQVGTDFALGQLAHLAQSMANRRSRQAAVEELAAAAEERGLTPDQLEDRSIPDLGLSTGGATFDYGPRKFRIVLGADLRPMAKDDKGKAFHSLPTPRKTDDAVLVGEAREAFREAKAQAADVLANVCRRFERGLTHQRRWPAEDFDNFVVKHAVAGAVARRLVWGWYGVDGSLTGTFRVTDEGEFAGPDDRPAEANAFQVGLAHPAQMSAADRAKWADTLADYEVVPPFTQLARPVFDMTDEEAQAVEVMKFAARRVPGPVVGRSLKANGWIRRNDVAIRTFPSVGVTAVVRLTGWDWMEVQGCKFLPKLDPNASFDDPSAVPVSQVDAVARCEVFADLDAWAKAAVRSE